GVQRSFTQRNLGSGRRGGLGGGGVRGGGGRRRGRLLRRAGGIGRAVQQDLHLGALAQAREQGADLVVGEEADDLGPRLLQADRLFRPPVLHPDQGPAVVGLERPDELAGLRLLQ